jgi:hypothetical protein
VSWCVIFVIYSLSINKSTYSSRQRSRTEAQNENFHDDAINGPNDVIQADSSDNIHHSNELVSELHLERGSSVDGAINDQFLQVKNNSLNKLASIAVSFQKFTRLLTTLKFENNIPSSMVNSIGTDILNLCVDFRKINPSSESMQLYKRVSSSDYLQEKLHNSRFGSDFIKPQSHNSLKDTQGRTYLFNYSTVSIESLMRKIMRNESVRTKLQNENSSLLSVRRTARCPTKGKISSLTESLIWPRLIGKLKLELYIDDCQLAPSVVFNQQQKYLFLYATFPDLPFENRCSKKDIDVILMANRKKLNDLVEKEGLCDPIGALLLTLKDEIKRLMQFGIKLDTDETIKLGLSCICGDNLGIYQLLGKIYLWQLQIKLQL